MESEECSEVVSERPKGQGGREDHGLVVEVDRLHGIVGRGRYEALHHFIWSYAPYMLLSISCTVQF